MLGDARLAVEFADEMLGGCISPKCWFSNSRFATPARERMLGTENGSC